jgi:alpha-D-ribose 1-methylphosphonate 5-phosphate C-P lyase
MNRFMLVAVGISVVFISSVIGAEDVMLPISNGAPDSVASIAICVSMTGATQEASTETPVRTPSFTVTFIGPKPSVFESKSDSSQ